MLRTWLVLVAVAGCRRVPDDARPRPQPPAPAVVVDGAVSVVDPSGPASIAVDAAVEVAWPIGIEVADGIEDFGMHGEISYNVSIPTVRTKPPELGRAITADLRRLVPPPPDPNLVGNLDARCDVVLACRLAVIVRCKTLHDTLTKAQIAESTGGGGASEPYLLADWLQPGLPALELAQFSTTTRATAAIAEWAKTADRGCSSCQWAPESFALDGEGLAFVATNECSSRCEDKGPRIALDELAPASPRAQKLVTWIRERVADSESLVE